MAPISIALVGLGRRTLRKALDAIARKPQHWQLITAADPDEKARILFQSQYPDIPAFQSVQEMLDWNTHTRNDVFQPVIAAYVAVPHHCYACVVPDLLSARIHLLKEKPAALTLQELSLYQELAESNSVVLMTAGQRRFGSATEAILHKLEHLGHLSSIEAKLKISVTNLDEGWRAQSVLAGGGAMGDLGWHLLDNVIGLMSRHLKCAPSVTYARMFNVGRSQGHDCEDGAEVILDFTTPSDNVSAHLVVSRVGHRDEEEITMIGQKGVLTFDGNTVCLHLEPKTAESLTQEMGKEHLAPFQPRVAGYRDDIELMFAEFHRQVSGRMTDLTEDLQQSYTFLRTQDFLVTQTMQEIYQRADLHMAKQQQQKSVEEPLELVTSSAQSGAQCLSMKWPVIDQAVERAVSTQLHEDISIYGSGGVFKQFEAEFREYHGVPSFYPLLHNSGTNALHALYFAAEFMPGDEVIFPVYTFHATCSPVMHFGVKPVFCDAMPDGTISVSAILAAITSKTKALVITHMWGVPCDMTAITSVLKQFPKILLFEDCSHAHGARFNGQPVGTFGDGAAWSLQGQKIITGGEGGITLTKHANLHYRQLILGHYNKRCKIEIPSDHYLHQFALTGAGLKNRAHPLAIAVALIQLRQLKDFHAWKTKFANQLTVKLSSISFLELPILGVENSIEPAWYAYVMRFKAKKVPLGLTREVFVAELHARGLLDIDIPRSTGLLHQEPLYNKPWELLPHLYSQESSGQDCRHLAGFEEAKSFYDEAVKLPVYATRDGQEATDRYVDAICEVATAWMKNECGLGEE